MADAPLRVLLPGSLCDERLFERLCAHWPSDTRVEVPDLHRLQPLAEWLPAQAARWSAQVDVIGFSLGAIVALGLLALQPQRVRRLVLVACNPSEGTPLHAQRVAQQRALWQAQGPGALAREMATQASPPGALDAAALGTLEAMATATPPAAFEAQGHLNVTRPDGRAALATWSGPLMLASGAADPWCGDDKQALLRGVRPDARWLRLPGAGHYLPLERPRELAEAIQDFLSTEHPLGATP